MGVARPRAQGQATTSTSTASLTLSASAPPGVAATTSGNRWDPASEHSIVIIAGGYMRTEKARNGA